MLLPTKTPFITKEKEVRIDAPHSSGMAFSWNMQGGDLCPTHVINAIGNLMGTKFAGHGLLIDTNIEVYFRVRGAFLCQGRLCC